MKKLFLLLHYASYMLLLAALTSSTGIAQNVGIGTTQPQALLHIKGIANISQLIIDANATQSNSQPLIRLRNAAGTDLLHIHSDNIYNTFFGLNAGQSNNASGGGTFNTFIGRDAGNSNTIGSYNIANGVAALSSNTTGDWNVASGYRALAGNVAGNHGTAIGFNAMRYANSTATSFTNYNVAVGYEALRGSSIAANNTGNSNTAIGYQSLRDITSGFNNTAAGREALSSNTSGDNNTAYGFQSLLANTQGHNNTAMGYRSLYANTTGDHNVAVGRQALYSNTTGLNNIAIGNNALFSNTTPSRSIAIGDSALMNSSSGTRNIALGPRAMFSTTTGDYNTAIGYGALYYITNAVGNTSVGYNSGNGSLYGNGNYNTMIGYSAVVTDGGNATALGYNAYNNSANSMVFGNGDVTKWGFGRNAQSGALQVGLDATNGNGAYLSSGGIWTNASDANKKENFQELDGRQLLESVMQLPITRWNYKGTSADNSHIGPMAQDFKRLFNVGEDDKVISSVDPAGIALRAIQELIKENNVLKERLSLQANDMLLLKNEIELIKSTRK